MIRWSSSLLNSEPASDSIRPVEWGTMSLKCSVNQLSNVINPAMWNNSNFSLVSISVYAVHQCLLRFIQRRMHAAMGIYHHIQRLLQSLGITIDCLITHGLCITYRFAQILT